MNDLVGDILYYVMLGTGLLVVCFLSMLYVMLSVTSQCESTGQVVSKGKVIMECKIL